MYSGSTTSLRSCPIQRLAPWIATPIRAIEAIIRGRRSGTVGIGMDAVAVNLQGKGGVAVESDGGCVQAGYSSRSGRPKDPLVASGIHPFHGCSMHAAECT